MKLFRIQSYLFFFIVFLQVDSVLAQQESKIKVVASTKEVGKNLINQQPINAVEYTFPERIHDFTLDTLNKYLTIQLRGLSNNGKWLDNKGDVVRYSINNNNVLWSKSIAYQTQTLDQYSGVTVRTAGGKSYVLNNETGEPVWEMKNSLVYVSGSQNIGLGYELKEKKGFVDMLEGISLKDGSVLWNRKIARVYGWDNVIRLNDSTVLIAAAGLHTVNLKSGKGWDYDAVTGKADYTASAVGTGLGIAAGLLTGMYSVSTGHDLIKNLSSDVYKDSLSNFYFGSKQFLTKLDKSGKVLWETKLPEEETSSSEIFKIKNNIVLINFGYATKNSKRINFGIPFIASFDSENGGINYKLNLAPSKESMIDFKISEDAIFVLFKNRVEKYAIKDGKLLASYDYDSAKYGDPSTFVGSQVFTKKEDIYTSLTAVSPSELFLYTKTGKLIILDRASLTAKNEMALDDYYISYARPKGLTFLKNKNATTVINREGKEIAQFAAAGQPTLLNNKLYTTNGSSFYEIDLAELLSNSVK